MTTDEIIKKMADGAATVRAQVRADIHNFSIPVKIEIPVWREWTANELDNRGFTQMAIDCRAGKMLQAHARVLAFEILFSLGGYECPLLCIPQALTGDEELAYWRAVAIAKNTPDQNGRRFSSIEPFATEKV